MLVHTCYLSFSSIEVQLLDAHSLTHSPIAASADTVFCTTTTRAKNEVSHIGIALPVDCSIPPTNAPTVVSVIANCQPSNTTCTPRPSKRQSRHNIITLQIIHDISIYNLSILRQPGVVYNRYILCASVKLVCEALDYPLELGIPNSQMLPVSLSYLS